MTIEEGGPSGGSVARPPVGGILQAVLTTPDLDGTLDAWTDLLGYEVVSNGPLDGALAESWGAPAVAGRRSALLRPDHGAETYVRWIERAAETPPAAPLKTYGWAALELTVRDVDALHEELAEDGRFTVLGPPTELSSRTGSIRCSVAGRPARSCT